MYKFNITVEVCRKDGKPITSDDLIGPVASFPRVAPKLFRKAIKNSSWPFNAKIEIQMVENQEQPKRKKKKKK